MSRDATAWPRPRSRRARRSASCPAATTATALRDTRRLAEQPGAARRRRRQRGGRASRRGRIHGRAAAGPGRGAGRAALRQRRSTPRPTSSRWAGARTCIATSSSSSRPRSWPASRPTTSSRPPSASAIARTPVPALVDGVDDRRWSVELERPAWAPAPGQAAVFYDGDEVVGGGRISDAQSGA